MADIQEKIAKLCPDAQFDTTGELLLVTVPDEKWHDLAKALKEQLGFDYLNAVVGVDWKDSLGCMYYLTNTETQDMLHVKVATTAREPPRLHTRRDLRAGAISRNVRCTTSSASNLSTIPICGVSSCAPTGWDTPCARTMTPTRNSIL